MQVDKMEAKLQVSKVKLAERTKAVVVKEKEFEGLWEEFGVEKSKFQSWMVNLRERIANLQEQNPGADFFFLLDDYRVVLEKFKAGAFGGGGLAKKVFKVSPNLEDTLASSPRL
ncbi:hypothetical protein Pint_21033 [Pistacia integerrima]|uniref:Uncharacterized protein n=1 Tax=Pistacia integerrima TaxID=434235 RepID=A0ACC0XE20_9ROSI|nr:hypothetical protein Pint_21033 [Pistacia integerrima]